MLTRKIQENDILGENLVDSVTVENNSILSENFQLSLLGFLMESENVNLGNPDPLEAATAGAGKLDWDKLNMNFGKIGVSHDKLKTISKKVDIQKLSNFLDNFEIPIKLHENNPIKTNLRSALKIVNLSLEDLLSENLKVNSENMNLTARDLGITSIPGEESKINLRRADLFWENMKAKHQHLRAQLENLKMIWRDMDFSLENLVGENFTFKVETPGLDEPEINWDKVNAEEVQFDSQYLQGENLSLAWLRPFVNQTLKADYLNFSADGAALNKLGSSSMNAFLKNPEGESHELNISPALGNPDRLGEVGWDKQITSLDGASFTLENDLEGINTNINDLNLEISKPVLDFEWLINNRWISGGENKGLSQVKNLNEIIPSDIYISLSGLSSRSDYLNIDSGGKLKLDLDLKLDNFDLAASDLDLEISNLPKLSTPFSLRVRTDGQTLGLKNLQIENLTLENNLASMKLKIENQSLEVRKPSLFTDLLSDNSRLKFNKVKQDFENLELILDNFSLKHPNLEKISGGADELNLTLTKPQVRLHFPFFGNRNMNLEKLGFGKTKINGRKLNLGSSKKEGQILTGVSFEKASIHQDALFPSEIVLEAGGFAGSLDNPTISRPSIKLGNPKVGAIKLTLRELNIRNPSITGLTLTSVEFSLKVPGVGKVTWNLTKIFEFVGYVGSLAISLVIFGRISVGRGEENTWGFSKNKVVKD